MSHYKENIEIIKTHPHLFNLCDQAVYFDHEFKYSITKEDNYSLGILINEKFISIHSTYYPMKEADQIISQYSPKSDTITVLGFGMGYHIIALLKKFPKHKIICIEIDKNLFLESLHYVSLSTFLNVEFYIGYTDYQLPKIKNLETSDLFYLKSLQKLYYSYYQTIERKLLKQSLYSLSSEWKYPKFQTENLKIIFLDSSYVLTKECLNGIKSCGHQLEYIHIDQHLSNYEVFIKDLLTLIIKFKPDFILTVNHLGFDKEGRLTQLLSELELPYASWFVDSPNVILSCFSSNISDYCSIFVWDKDYISDVQLLSYPYVDYLPLATDPNIFYPKKKTQQYRYDVSFVGSSMVYASHKNTKSFIHRPDLLKLIEEISNMFIQKKYRRVQDALHDYEIDNQVVFDDIEQKEDFLAAVLWRSTQKHRLSGIMKLEKFNSVISGDENWYRLLPKYFRIIPERWYYETLCDFYNESRINFNMTSLQMKNSVNQRVFDVPACQQVLLTDYKDQLNEVFDCNKDIIVYHDVNEIESLLDFYLARESICQKMAENSYLKVLNGHTYTYRIKQMTEIMRKRYKN